MKELGLHDISILGVWYAIHLWQLHQDDKITETYREWFDKWYGSGPTLTITLAEVPAYSCYVLDHAVGYAHVTKYLAYEHIGHAKERQPKGFKSGKHLHIGERQFVGECHYSSGFECNINSH
jgi:hypothetical protein